MTTTTRRHHHAPLTTMLLAVALLAACESPTEPAKNQPCHPPPSEVQISIITVPQTMQVGDTVRLNVSIPVEVTSSAPDVVGVLPGDGPAIAGVLVARSAGTADVRLDVPVSSGVTCRAWRTVTVGA